MNVKKMKVLNISFEERLPCILCRNKKTKSNVMKNKIQSFEYLF